LFHYSNTMIVIAILLNLVLAKPNQWKRSKLFNRTVKTAINSNIAVFCYTIYRALKLLNCPALGQVAHSSLLMLFTHLPNTHHCIHCIPRCCHFCEHTTASSLLSGLHTWPLPVEMEPPSIATYRLRWGLVGAQGSWLPRG